MITLAMLAHYNGLRPNDNLPYGKHDNALARTLWRSATALKIGTAYYIIMPSLAQGSHN